MIHVAGNTRQPNREAWSLERLIHDRSVFLGMALDSSSFGAYLSHLNYYLTFCNLHHLPIDPTPDTLSYFVTFMSHHIQPRSVDTYLSGVANQLEPHFPHVRQSHLSPLVKRTVQGALRPLGRSASRKQPILRDDLLQVLQVLQHPLTHDDLLWITQLHCGFYALLRLGELVSPHEIALRDFSKLSLRTSVCISDTNFSFLLQRDKTDIQYERNRELIQHLLVSSDPLPLFQHYLASRDLRFPLNPYLWVRYDGCPPTWSWLIHRPRLFFPSNVSGHSSGATSLAAAGVSPDQIHAIGQWRSGTWERYVRKTQPFFKRCSFTVVLYTIRPLLIFSMFIILLFLLFLFPPFPSLFLLNV
jgi:hypothetical protein